MASTDTLFVGVWSVILALNCLWLVAAVLLWNRRCLEPVRSRRPRLLLAVAYLFVLLDLWVCLGTVFIDHVPMAVSGIMNGLFLEGTLETFTFFCFSLYVAYRRTLSQIKIGEDASDNARRKWIAISTWLLKDHVAFMWVANQALILLVVHLIYLAYYPQLWHVSVRTGVDDPTSGAFRNIAAYRSMATALIAVIVSINLRGVSDAFGTVDMMKRTGLAGLVGLVMYAGLYKTMGSISPFALQSLVAVIACNACLWFVMGRPLLDTYRPVSAVSLKDPSNPERNLETFEDFLTTPKGFAAFQEHLQTEFAVESLLFWAAVRKFRCEFTRDERGMAAAQFIYESFLTPTSPLQVNLPSSSFREFAAIFENAAATGRVNADMFNGASDQMLKLMEVNSLARFQKSSKGHIWAEFDSKARAPVPLSDTTTDDIIIPTAALHGSSTTAMATRPTTVLQIDH
ncbi:unnamed protein product (mitochondrion) [Plasmodiophora brassicae]|uniref:RGS domain-containing protein n=1 Tax=Plasmodiophora brassicae TaxID=37360 RepID=A0A0G4IXZ8_PLABS|nr:hypothetical protein PBRA_007758 [Plasmodiophora brassicae]SPQ99067.1 unnamed protein product [Plasmodiophora brassicae]